MTLNKEEFKVMAMLCAANIDGNIKSEEVKIMLQKTDFDTVERVEKLFAKMSDMEVLDCIRENMAQYAATETERMAILDDLRTIIEADEKCTAIEEQIVSAFNRLF